MRLTIYGILLLTVLGLGCKNGPGSSLAKADIFVNAGEMARSFEQDERMADSLYLYKIVAVRGIVEKIWKRESGEYVISLGGKIDCNLDTLYNRRYLSLKNGDSVTLRGTCAGRLLNVILMQCIIEK